MQLLNISPAKNVLEELFNKVMSSNVITSNERQQIRRILLIGRLDNDEYLMIKNLVDHVSRGCVKVVE
ncbi:hypothetical protein [Okeania sp.]|uniref:hypothetical protein n=1 Tax=Okeania sp. TaxID=3100323 RepID=UPI002B4B187F|nr:hypothetical protein [Okeania sp.]MEB3340908.1 hypothetical protein [Okeania sp.]